MKRTPLRSSRPGQKRRRAQPKRFWGDAEVKRGPCRLWRSGGCEGPRIELAHVIGREHDEPIGDDPTGAYRGYDLYVLPCSVIPLCTTHHGQYDRHETDVLHVLHLDEQLQAVRDAGSVESMRRRTAPTAYQRSAA